MVAIVSGNSLGVSLTSMNTLGQRGAQGVATQGRNGEQTYVNVFSGNLVLQDRDDMLVNHGIDIAALRTYNSQGKFTDDNGDNWSSGVYSQQLRINGSLSAAGSSIVRTGRDGSESTYLYDTTRQLYISTDGSGAYNTISVNAGNGQLVWSNGSSGLKETYDGSGSGRLLSSTDSNGNTITYSYGANGLLASVTDAAGEATYYDYNGTNLSQIRTVTADGHTLTRVRYGYDASNRLSTVTLDLTPADNAISDNQVYRTTYTYDGNSKRIASVTQSDGSSQSFTYVQVGADYRIATVQDGLNHITSYSYDTVSGRTTVIDPLGLKTLYDYDSAGQLTRITTPAVAGVAASTSFSYNATGDVIQVVDGEGHAIDMQYDSNGNQVLQRDAAGNTVTRTYDGNNQLVTETTYLVPDPDGTGAGLPGTPLTTRYIYDSSNHNRLRFVVSAEGRVTEYRYNSYGERTSSIQYAGATYGVANLGMVEVPTEAALNTWAGSQDQTQITRTDMVYDARGQLQTSSSWSAIDAQGNGVTNGSQTVIQYVYDQAGLLLNTTDGRGGLTQATYDGLGRILTSKDAANQLTISSYDDANHKTTVTQANGLSTISAYDQAGRLVSVQQSNAGQVLGTTQYVYDADDRLRMTQDPTGVRSFILYDDDGRKIADIDGNGSVTEYLYNKDNQLTQTIAYATAIDIGQLADAAGNLTAATLATVRPAAGSADRKTWRAYDSTNRLSKMVDGQPGLVSEYRYDGASRLVSTISYASLVDTSNLGSAPSANSIAPTASDADRVSRSFYDNDGLLRATLDAEGYLTEQRYDSAGHVASRVGYATQVDAGLRAAGTLAQLQPAASTGDIVTQLLLNGKGQIAGEIDGEGYLTEKVFDANGNVVKTVRYANKVTATVAANTTVADIRPAASADDHVTATDYDALNRIKQQTNAEGTVTQYMYDNAGNLSQTIRAAGTSDVRAISARYDIQGRLTGELSAEGNAQLTGNQTQAQIDAIWSSYGLTHAYDAAGRRISTTDQNGNKTLFFYDVDNHLTQTVNALGEVSEKQYNGLGQLVATVQYGTRISTSGLAGGLVNAALTSALNAVRNSSLDSVNGFTYNANGTLATSTDALKNITTYSYDAFGERVSSTTNIDATHVLTQTSSYDRRGLMVGTGADAPGVNATTTTQYDAFGRVIRSVDANGNSRSQSYDRLGRIVQTVDPLNAQRTTTYDAFDRTLTQTDGLGNVTRYSYNTTARSTTLTTPEGVAVTTVRTRNGQTQSVTDGLGNVTQYSYDKNGNLLSTAAPLTTTTSSTYDHANRLISTIDARGTITAFSFDAANRVLTRQVDPNGLNLTTRYQYDAKGQQVVTTDANGVVTQISFNLKGQALSQTLDPAGLKLTTQYSYDGSGNVLTVTSPGGTVTQYVYDNLGRRIEQHVDPSGLNLTTNTSYDKKGNAVTVTDPNRNVTRYVYDANDRLAFTVDAQGDVTQTTYDANGRVLQTTKYATPISLNGLSAAPVPADIQSRLASNAADATELRRYDRDGRLIWIIDAAGAVTQNSYDANGNVVKRLAYATRLGANDLAVLKTNAVALPAPAADAAHDRITQIAYDALGRAIYIVDASGAVVEQHYDGNGNSIERITYVKTIPVGQPATLANIAQQLASIADPAHDGHVVNVYDSANRLIYTANAAGAASQIGYDNNNNVVRRTDYVTPLTGPLTATTNLAAVSSSSADQTSNYVYDAANRRIYSVDAMGAVTQQTYDANGYVTQTVRYAKPVAIPVITAPTVDDSVTVYVYDAAGRVTQQTKAAGTAAAGTVGYVYDALGNAVSITNERGYTTTQQFDALGRKTSTSVPLNNGVDDKGPPQYAVTATQYDAFGNAVKVTDPMGNAGYFYYDQDNRVVLQIDPLGYATQTSYTASGKPSLVVRYAMPVSGPLSASTQPALTASAADAPTKLEYDQNDRLFKSTDAEGNFELFGYDGAGNRISYQNKVGGVTTSTYDGRGLLLSETLPVTSRNSAGVLVPVVKQYSYDARGNRTQMIEAAGLPEQRTTNYIYDQNNRLITQSGDAVTIRDAKGWSVGSPTQHWTYDAAGNKTSYTDANGNRTSWYYDAANRKIAELSAAGTLSVWSYDAASNMTSTRVYGDAVPTPAANARPTVANGSNFRETIYSYDRNNRQVQTLVNGATIAQRPIGGTDVNITFGQIKTFQQYDALGNVISQTDGLGNQTFFYYNKVGKKIAQVDAENYLTVWTRDQNDSVTVEYRYANRLSIVATTDSVVSQLAQNAGSNSNDRITTSSYDHVNRLLTQSRLNLVTSSLNGTGGLVTATGAATTRYIYDGLGNVIEKTEANGDVSDWIFDAMGRQTRAQGASFIDFEGASVRPTTDTVYDGLGNVQQSIVRGKNSADDRVTNFAYDVAGRLGRKSTQGVDGSYEYFYDAVGNVTEARVLSKNSDGGNRWDATVILYDAANRELSRQQVTAVGGDPSKQQFVGSDTHQVRYNAYGEVVAKGVNGSTAEFAEYDSLGRLWKTNAGDGATKAYLYDSNGNATVLLQSAGADMRNMTLAQILAISQAQGTSPDPVVQAAIAAGGIHMTVSIYDRRNQLTDTYQPTMQSAHNMGTIQQFLTQEAGSNFTAGGVTVGPTKASAGNTATLPPQAVQGSVSISKIETVNFSFRSTKETMDIVGQPTVLTRSYSITVPPSLRYGGGNLHVKINGGEYAAAVSASTGTLTFTQSHASWTATGSGTTSLMVEVYQDGPDGSPTSQFLIARTTITLPNHAAGTYSYDDTATGAANTKPLILYKGQSPSTDRLVVMIRPSGTDGPWIIDTAKRLTNDTGGGVINGWFYQDWSGTGEGGPFELQYIALDAGGNVLNVEKGTMLLSASNAYITQSPQPIGGAGQAVNIKDVWYKPDNAFNIINQGAAAQSVRVHYRHAGTAEAWSIQTLGPAGIAGTAATPGWFALRTEGFSGNYEYFIETFTGANATGTMINRASGTFTPGGATSALQSWTDLPENVIFNNQPANSAKMLVTYTVDGGPPTTIELNTWDAVHNQFNWDASTVVADRLNNYRVTFQYKTLDANGTIVNAAHGSMQIGADPVVFEHTLEAAPATVTFNPPTPNATTLVLQYRNAGSTGNYTPVTLTRDVTGKFRWNVDALRPGAGTVSLEYAYDLYDANGQPVAPPSGNPRAQGVLNIKSDKSSTTSQLQWTITGLNNTAPDVPNTQAAIHRIQERNAFGDITAEIDGLTHRTTLTYDTMGQLTVKQAPETNVTREDGSTVRATPTTQYYYDASSHLVGVRDANGNLNSMTQLAGFGDATGNNARITKEFHADGGSKTNAYDIFGDLRTATDELGRVTSNTYDKAGRLIQVVHAARQPGTASNPGPTAVSSVDSYTYDTLGNRISHTNAMQQRETTDYDADGRVIRTRSYAGQEVTYTYSYDQTILGVGSLPVGGWVKVTSYTGSRSASDKTDYFQHTTSHQDFGGHVVTYSYDYAAHLKNQTSTAGQNVDYSYYANGYVKSTTDHALNMLSYFEYDEEGNRTRESYTTADAPANRIYYQLADIKYDELNRVVDYVDPQAHIQYQYDANGNRRRVLSSYNDAISGAPATQDFWYKYDSQNRFVLTMGQLSNGVIGLGANGVQIGYDVAGQRRSASYADGHSEAYDYTSDGYLEDVRINGVLRSRRGNDLLGRVQNYSEYADNGSTVIYNKASQFDADNRLLQDTVVNSPVGGTATTTITKYDYRLKDGNGNYTGADQGVVTHSFQYDPSKAAGTGVHTDTSYVWWDEAKQSQITLRGTDPANPNAVYWKPGLSDFTYDVNGHVKQVHSFNEGTMSNTLQNAKTLTYTSDQYGQVLRRDMMIGATLGLTQRYYYLNGQLIGDISNNGPTNISYAEQLAQRGNPSGNFFRYGKPVASADFDQNYQPINADYPGASASSYTAKDGDTLSSIARAVWGDSTLWYLIADANGLTNGDHIVAGQVISIPNKVSNFHNTASTFRVYNPGQAIGDTLPYLPTEPLPPPPPSADGGCGGFVQMIALVVAIVVTIYTAGAAAQMLAPAATVGAGAGATTVAGASVWSAGIATVGGGLTGAGMAGIGAAAIGGAVGALASQAIMISGGQQNGFNWSGVAMGAVGAGVTAGIGAGTFSSNGFTNAVVSGAVRSTATQGLGVATGLQSTFDWRSVAISAISSGSAYGASAGVHDWDMGKAFEQATRGTAAGIVSTLMRGGGVGKNIGSIAGDVIASTIGNAVVDQMTGASTRTIDFEAATRQYEADIVNGRMQLLADSTSVKNSPDRLLNGPSIMSTDADDGIDDGWQKVEITEKRLTSLEKLASYAQDIKDFLTTPDYNQLSDQQLARLPVSNFAANREKVNRAAAQGTIPYTMGGVVSDFAYKTASAGVSAVMTAPVAGYVATRVGVGYLGRAITGGAAGGVFNTTQQLLDNAVHVLSGGEVGRSGFSTLELSTSTFLGVGLGVAAKGVPEVWAWAKEKIVVNATLDAQAAFRTNFVGPTIGRSGFLSTEELSDSVFGRYQQFTDVAYQEVLDAEASGALRIRPGVSRNTIIGQRTDRIAQSYLDTWIQAEQIPDGFVNINKYLRDPAGTGAYRIPDVRVPSAGQIFDGTIGFKWNTTSQIIDFSKFSGGNRITIVRPTIEGGSYSIP